MIEKFFTMKKLWICGAAWLLGACQTMPRQNGVPVERIDPDTIHINCTLLQPIQLVPDSGLLWISDYGASSMVWALDLATGDTIAAFLHKGRGPREGRPPIDIRIAGNDLFLCTNFPSYLFVGERQAAIRSGDRALTRIARLPSETYSYLFLSDTTLLLSGCFDGGRFGLMNLNRPDTLAYTGTFPDCWSEERTIPAAAKNRFHYPALLYRHTRTGVIAVCTPYVLEFFRPNDRGVEALKDTLLAEYRYDYQNSGAVRTSKKRADIVNGCRSATVNGRHIYLSFDTATESLPSDDSSHPILLVYDWEGRHVRTIDPGCKLTALAVDSDDRYLYALADMDSENGPKIVRIGL